MSTQQVYKHKGKYYRLAMAKDVGKTCLFTDISFDSAMTNQRCRVLHSICKDDEFAFEESPGYGWKYAFIEDPSLAPTEQPAPKRLTPEQAWKHATALWPSAKRIKSRGAFPCELTYSEQGYFSCSIYLEITIDWPEGVTEWPPRDEYREPTADDVGKMVEVRINKFGEWFNAELLAVLPNGIAYRFICRDSEESSEHQCWEHARIKVDA